MSQKFNYIVRNNIAENLEDKNNNILSLSETIIEGNGIFYEKYKNNSTVNALFLSNITTINGASSMRESFSRCTNLTSVDLSNLIAVNEDFNVSAMFGMFFGCTSLTSVNLSKLTTVGEYAIARMFYNCTNLANIDLSSLTTIGDECMESMFYGCTSLTTLSFPSLTSNSFGSYTTQFNNMLSGVTGCTVHFPSNLQTVIGSWSSVQNGFGGTNTVVLFDLPATT